MGSMEQIKTAIAPMFETADGLEMAAMNIFLTMKGVRPACLPFDIEGGHDKLMKRFHDNPDVKKHLEEIPELLVIEGPYFDTGDAIVVACKARYATEVKPILDELTKIAAEHGDRRGDIPEVHILIGKLLGYVCPSDINKIYDEEAVDDIEFIIEGRSYMGVWCPRGGQDNKKKAEEMLEKINEAIEELGLVATITFGEKRFDGGGDKKRRTRKTSARKIRKLRTRRASRSKRSKRGSRRK